MITNAIATADTIPPTTSTRIATRCDRSSGSCSAWCSTASSTSSLACQKNRYGRHRRAEHGDERGEPRGAACEVRDEQPCDDRSPVDVDRQEDDRVREERQREPSQHARVPVVGTSTIDRVEHAAGEDDEQALRGQARRRAPSMPPSQPTSAAMLNVFAIPRPARRRTGPGARTGRRIRVASPRPVASPRRAASLLHRGRHQGDDERGPEQRVSEPRPRPVSTSRCRTGRRRPRR